MGTPLISIVVPIYKVEPYLDRCVRSVLDQTYQNIEVILVDDGSPDNCGALCDEWAKKDDRIRVVHKKNGGISDARNAGMAVATGEYIGFVDSDDYIAPDMYSRLYERMLADQSDISVCRVQMVWEDGTPPRVLTREGSCVLDRAAAMEQVIVESWFVQVVWDKLYKTELVKDIAFPVGRKHEDIAWLWQAVARAQKVSVFDAIGYFYVQHGDSYMAEKYSMRRLDALLAKQERLAFLEKEFPTIAPKARKDLLFTCMYHGQQAMRDLKKAEKKKALRFIADVFKTVPKENLNMPLSHKGWVALAKVSFPLCCALRNALGIGR